MADPDSDQTAVEKQTAEDDRSVRLEPAVELLQQSDRTSDSDRTDESNARALANREKGEELSCPMTNKLMIEDFAKTDTDDTETVRQRSRRKSSIERNLHNTRTYYEQRNNFESDEASDIQSEIESNGERVYTYDEKMRALVKMFVESFVPFHLIHGSYFQNLLRNSFGIRKMPKLIEFRNFFETIHELGGRYIKQTLGGAQSYTLIFEFWKTTNRRHQYLTIRGSYIDVFVRR